MPRLLRALALSLVLAKTAGEEARFAICFDRFFSREGFGAAAPPPPGQPLGVESPPSGTVGEGQGSGFGLAAMLRDDRPMVGVKDGAKFVGVLTPNGVNQALRASLAGD